MAPLVMMRSARCESDGQNAAGASKGILPEASMWSFVDDAAVKAERARAEAEFRAPFARLFTNTCPGIRLEALFLSTGILRDPELVTLLRGRRNHAAHPELAAINYFIARATENGPEADIEALAFLHSLPEGRFSACNALYGAEDMLSSADTHIQEYLEEKYVAQGRFGDLAIHKMLIADPICITFMSSECVRNYGEQYPAVRDFLERHPEGVYGWGLIDAWNKADWDNEAVGREHSDVDCPGVYDALESLIGHPNVYVRLLAYRMLNQGIDAEKSVRLYSAAKARFDCSNDPIDRLLTCQAFAWHPYPIDVLKGETWGKQCERILRDEIPLRRKGFEALMAAEAVAFGPRPRLLVRLADQAERRGGEAEKAALRTVLPWVRKDFPPEALKLYETLVENAE